MWEGAGQGWAEQLTFTAARTGQESHDGAESGYRAHKRRNKRPGSLEISTKLTLLICDSPSISLMYCFHNQLDYFAY